MKPSLQEGPHAGHRVITLPILYLTVRTGCDCRCVMCDIWKAEDGGADMSLADMEAQAEAIRRLKVRYVLISGGEPLKNRNLWTFCRSLREQGVKVVLETTGLLLEPNADETIRSIDQLTVSVDGSPAVHDRIRQVNGCAEQLAAGIKAILARCPDFAIVARTVVQKFNCQDLHNVVRFGTDLGLRAVSFVAADVSSTAFNRPTPWDEPKISQIALSHSELCKLSRSVELLLTDYSKEFERGFILNTPAQLWDIYRYYKALLGQCDFPPVKCRAPWISAVLEADGCIRPCFFHAPYAKVGEKGLLEILNSREAIRFRRELKVSRSQICRKCVWAESRAGYDIVV
ncbi:MAG: radical SAM protein [Acidobacteriota bacterium]